MGLFLAVTEFYMTRPAAQMSQEIIDDLKRWYSLAHNDDVDHQVELIHAMEKIDALHVISTEPGVVEALSQARVALVQHRDISLKDTQRLMAPLAR